MRFLSVVSLLALSATVSFAQDEDTCFEEGAMCNLADDERDCCPLSYCLALNATFSECTAFGQVGDVCYDSEMPDIDYQCAPNLECPPDADTGESRQCREVLECLPEGDEYPNECSLGDLECCGQGNFTYCGLDGSNAEYDTCLPYREVGQACYDNSTDPASEYECLPDLECPPDALTGHSRDCREPLVCLPPEQYLGECGLEELDCCEGSYCDTVFPDEEFSICIEYRQEDEVCFNQTSLGEWLCDPEADLKCPPRLYPEDQCLNTTAELPYGDQEVLRCVTCFEAGAYPGACASEETELSCCDDSYCHFDLDADVANCVQYRQVGQPCYEAANDWSYLCAEDLVCVANDDDTGDWSCQLAQQTYCSGTCLLAGDESEGRCIGEDALDCCDGTQCDSETGACVADSDVGGECDTEGLPICIEGLECAVLNGTSGTCEEPTAAEGETCWDASERVFKECDGDDLVCQGDLTDSLVCTKVSPPADLGGLCWDSENSEFIGCTQESDDDLVCDGDLSRDLFCTTAGNDTDTDGGDDEEDDDPPIDTEDGTGPARRRASSFFGF
eukprot:Clim_evm18s225 gene=Clim_evmTU18s225